MSRIGKQIINIPDGCKVENNNNCLTITGPKGNLIKEFNKNILININDNKTINLEIKDPTKAKELNPIYGTSAALIKNMLAGVSQGYKKELNIVGVGYRASLKDNCLTLNIGFSHPVIMQAPKGILVELPKPTEIIISGIDKELVGQFSALIRSKKIPEPYLGKGILYKNEKIIRKEGKAAGK